jgi:hypothetical protein
LGLLFIPLVFAEIMVATGPTRILRLAFAALVEFEISRVTRSFGPPPDYFPIPK